LEEGWKKTSIFKSYFLAVQVVSVSQKKTANDNRFYLRYKNRL